MVTKTHTMPRSGAARRRAKAVARAEAVVELDIRWAFRLNRFPLRAESCFWCSCGYMAWLMPGATDEEYGEHALACSDHTTWCYEEYDDLDGGVEELLTAPSADDVARHPSVVAA
ncbi:hypothetical protein P5P86_11930 [Nocardioides sp. BP30]|uniref:hypothetical protein n=1 Tax=Nocardioides sp. BP30 TaxID=3036374 RepID=UPI002468BE66|nr:hypothetical protein [Nocardioides sp. BP30]WGL50673.1 hypothetical protein P5P86_11930 [Nocardioides sp. BP30]